MKRTNLSDLRKGDPVNLEHSLGMKDLNSGHYVQGHVNGTGTIANTWREDDSLWVRISCDENIIRGVVEKGYVAIDGTSLTVCEVGDGSLACSRRAKHQGDVGGEDSEKCWFTFMLVRHTQEHIILPRKNIGSPVNIEVDVMGQYADRSMSTRLASLVSRVEDLETNTTKTMCVALVGGLLGGALAVSFALGRFGRPR